MLRWESAYTIASGAAAISAASARTGFEPEINMSLRPTWTGYCDESGRTTYGRKKLVQSAAKLKNSTSATTGLASGSATRRNIENSRKEQLVR